MTSARPAKLPVAQRNTHIPLPRLTAIANPQNHITTSLYQTQKTIPMDLTDLHHRRNPKPVLQTTPMNLTLTTFVMDPQGLWIWK